MLVYLNGDYLPKEAARISPDDRGFLFADGAYEVFHAYEGHLFHAEGHLERMARSLREIRIEGPDPDHLRTIAKTLLHENELETGNAVVYLQITRGAAPRKHAFPSEALPPTIYATAFPHTVPRDLQEHGVKAILTPDIRWTRCDIKSVALLPNVLAHQQAKDLGAHEAIFVRDGALTEGALTNVFGVFEGRLRTYPRSPYILAGITRDVVLALSEALQIPVDESPILEQDLARADELMLCNTTSEILPVTHVDDHRIGGGIPGPITRRLQHAYREAVEAARRG